MVQPLVRDIFAILLEDARRKTRRDVHPGRMVLRESAGSDGLQRNYSPWETDSSESRSYGERRARVEDLLPSTSFLSPMSIVTHPVAQRVAPFRSLTSGGARE
jgi:hypothetical protein